MQNYEAKKPSYFATPSPQLIHALHTTLTQILSLPMSERFARHAVVSDSIKAHVASLGLRQLAAKPENQAHGMTAIYLPEGIKPTDVLPKLANKGVIFAGGLHREIATKYIRFGHMGVSIMDESRGDVKKALDALEGGLTECGWKKA
jgi:alanine-glyoxylate transaminase/serine-glyoxylate transaminase/serine-pyruvate transaminase